MAPFPLSTYLSIPPFVITGPVPVIQSNARSNWVAGTIPAMTVCGGQSTQVDRSESPTDEVAVKLRTIPPSSPGLSR
jgi:hypothetical protein